MSMDQALHEDGPIAFGVLALLVLWRAIVQPTLAVNRIDREAITAAAKSVESAAKTIESSTVTIDAAARWHQEQPRWGRGKVPGQPGLIGGIR